MNQLLKIAKSDRVAENNKITSNKNIFWVKIYCTTWVYRSKYAYHRYKIWKSIDLVFLQDYLTILYNPVNFWLFSLSYFIIQCRPLIVVSIFNRLLYGQHLIIQQSKLVFEQEDQDLGHVLTLAKVLNRHRSAYVC